MRSDHYYARLERLGTKEVRADRKKLEQDIKAYLKGGGKITAVPTGYSKSSDVPMRSWSNESRMRKKEGKV